MSDVLITRDGPYDAPYTYTLGAREAFQPTTVEGLVDGSAAGGDFKIVCVIRSPDGKVLARVPTSETFTSGDEVAVTFAPFLRGAAAAAVAASGLPTARVRTAVGLGNLGPGGTNLTWTLLRTDAPTIFGTTGAHPTWLTIAEDGFYAFFANVNLTASPTSLTGTLILSLTVLDNNNNPVITFGGPFVDIFDATAADPKEVETAQGWEFANILATDPAPYHAIVTLSDSVAISVSAVDVVAVQLSPTPQT